MSDFFGSCKIKKDGIAYVLPMETACLLKDGATLVDIRSDLETEIKAFGVENVIYLPHYDFGAKWATLPLEKPLILADAVGIWSKHFAEFLKVNGIADVASLAGGIADWEKDGYPVTAGKYQPLNGPCPCMMVPRERK